MPDYHSKLISLEKILKNLLAQPKNHMKFVAPIVLSFRANTHIEDYKTFGSSHDDRRSISGDLKGHEQG